jgi:hypothetical protein
VYHVDPTKYWTIADPLDGTGETPIVTPAEPPVGMLAASGVPVTVGGVTVIVNGAL